MPPHSAETAESDEAARRIAGRRRRRRAGTAALLALALAVAGLWALASSALSLGLGPAQSAIEAQLQALTGHPVSVDGETSFSLFPRAVLTLSNVRIGSEDPADGFLLEIDRISAHLDLAHALVGRTRIDRLTLLRPELLIGSEAGDASGAAPAPPIAASRSFPRDPEAGAPYADYVAASALLEGFFRRFEGIGEMEVRDGLLRAPDPRFDVSNANLVLAWPDRTATAELTGSLVWNGEPNALGVTLEEPLSFLAGETRALAWRIESASLEAGFLGQGSAGAFLQLDGDLHTATPSLSRTLRWLGSAAVPDFGAFTLDTRLTVVRSRMNLGSARLGVGGDVGEGALEATIGGAGRRSFVSGTLAFDRLNLDGLARAVAPLPRYALDIQRPIRSRFIGGIDLDIRLSANGAVLGPLNFGDVAATMKFAGGVATLDLGDAAFLGGRAEARLTVDAARDVPTATAHARLAAVDAGELAALLGIGGVGVTGPADFEAEIRTPVASWGDVLRQNRSDIRLTIAGGSLTGIDPALLLAQGSRPMVSAASADATPFERIEARIRTEGPTAAMDLIRIAARAGIFEASGQLSLPDDRLDLAGRFAPSPLPDPEEAGSFTPSKPVEVKMRGEWPNPIVVVDATTKPI